MRSVLGLLPCFILAGCASDLEVFRDAAGTPTQIAGVPFRAPELYVRHGTYSKSAKGGPCEPTPFAEAEALPLGPLYYVNMNSAEFAKSGLNVKFNDKGAVSEISMNTEPSAGEALKNAGELIKAVTPLVGLGAAAPSLAGTNPACDAGPTAVKWTIFSEWTAGGR